VLINCLKRFVNGTEIGAEVGPEVWQPFAVEESTGSKYMLQAHI
jgi:hypothetical protein